MSDLNIIEALITRYFRGLHEKDIDAIESIFWHHAEMTGYYEGDFIHAKLNDYLNTLKRMSAPNMLGEDFKMTICGVEIVGNMAFVKTHYLFQALNYVDFLTLLQIDGQWKIVNKTFYHD